MPTSRLRYMAKRSKKVVEVQKFGGVDGLGTVKDENFTKFKSGMSGNETYHRDVNYDMQSIETQSETHLEDDHGGGGAAIVRMFEFGMNPQAFAQYHPTKQELFNTHYKGIELALWKDGMKVMPEVNPKLVVDEKKAKYMIFVGAQPMRGHILTQQPKTLAEQLHGGK